MSDKSNQFIKSKEDVIQDKTYLTRQIETSIALLESTENSIVLEALLFLSKYGNIKIENLQYIQKRGLMGKLVKLLDRNVCILRITLRLLGILLSLPEAIAELDREVSDETILKVVDMYVTTTDDFVKEYCILILVKLAQSSRIIELIFNADLFTPIFEFLGSSDKESLIKDTLNLFYYLVNAPAALSMLPDLKCYNAESLMKFINHPNQVIKSIAMEIIRLLASYQINALQKKFREAHLVEEMLRILMDPERKLQHNKALSILTLCMGSNETNTYFVDTVEFIRFCAWVKTCDSEYLELSSKIFQLLTAKQGIRQILFDLSVEDAILLFFRSKDRKVLNNALKAVSNMSQHTYCCEKMLTPVIFKRILSLLKSPGNDEDPENEIPLKTLYDFAARNYVTTTEMIVQYDGLPTLLKILKNSHNLSVESFNVLLHLLNMVSVHPVHKHQICSPGFYDEVLKNLRNEHIFIVNTCAEILTNFASIEKFRDYFLEHHLADHVLKLIKETQCLPLIKSLLVFIHSLLVYRNICEAFLHAKIIKVLKKLPENIRQSAPLIDRILKLMFDLNLPIKFFEVGYLSVRDKITDRFYIITGIWRYPLPFLEVYEAQEKCPINTVYLVDYSYQSNNYLDDSTSNSSDVESWDDESIKSLTSNNYTINYGHISPDPYLPRFIYDIRKFINSEVCLEHKVRLLAEFVETLLCGPKEGLDLPHKIHQFKLHVQMIKEKLGSNIIPIGYLRMGFHCERALLFKAIADKIGIPTTLTKGRGAIYWNEIILTQGFEAECGEVGSCGRLEIFVVDLMENVGKLLRKDSKEANAYCKIVF